MGIVNEYTRLQWEYSGGWDSIEPFVDGVMLLFHDDGDPDVEDVEPQVIRVDTATGEVWPEDQDRALPPIPFRYYRREGSAWVLEEVGETTTPHTRVRMDRAAWYRAADGQSEDQDVASTDHR